MGDSGQAAGSPREVALIQSHEAFVPPPRGRVARLAFAAALLLASFAAGQVPDAAVKSDEPAKPESPAERVAGHWMIRIDGLAELQDPLPVSLAADGDLLLGTVTVGRKTLSIHSGRIVGSQFRFSFDRVSGETILMRGGPGPRGLEGTWQRDHDKGRWTARPLGRRSR